MVAHSSCLPTLSHVFLRVGVIVPIGVWIALSDCNLWPASAEGGEEAAFRRDECDSITSVFAVVVAYFLFDALLVVKSRYALWQVV